jgi:hypothetical protein
MGIRGIISVANTSSSRSVEVNDECKTNELFHIRVITNNVKVDTLVICYDLGLETKSHPKPSNQ